MSKKYTKVAANTFDSIQINAGMVLTSFDVDTGTVVDSNILGATSGGVTFEANPTYIDFGEDIDNVPANTKQLKQLDSIEAKLSGTFVVSNPALVKKLMASADNSGKKITPRGVLAQADFGDIWWVGDYSGTDGGFIAIHLLNALSTGGYKLKSNDSGKGTSDFEFVGHYDLSNMDVIPYEVYISDGAGA